MGRTDDPVLQEQEALRPEPFVSRPVRGLRTKDCAYSTTGGSSSTSSSRNWMVMSRRASATHSAAPGLATQWENFEPGATGSGWQT
jgi:hypothetical protein